MEATSLLTWTLVFLSFLSGSLSLSYAGCFTLGPGLTEPKDVFLLGWTDKWEVKDISYQFCVSHCIQKSKKYAAVGTESGSKTYCVCGTEQAYKNLGVADHKISSDLAKCQHSIWYMNVFVAAGDVSLQYIGCFKEDPTNPASSSNQLIDPWIMSPSFCINYCANNGAANANLREGDTCTCGSGYSKYGPAPISDCNQPCPASEGEMCGGAKANSVYSTISPGELLKPDTSIITHGFHTTDAVKVPLTNSLPQHIYALQQAISQQSPSPSVVGVDNLLAVAKQYIQDTIDMTIPLGNLGTSGGFKVTNAPSTRAWLSQRYPAQLQPFADLLKRAHTFIDQDVKAVLDYIRTVDSKSYLLMPSIDHLLLKIKSYKTNGITFRGIPDAIRAAQQMVSASRFCLPLIKNAKKKSEMVNNLENVSKNIIDGPSGSKASIQLIQHPFTNFSIAGIPPPAIDPHTWQANVQDISTTWQNFVSQRGIQLYTLISTKYDIVCPNNTNPSSVVGKRSACQDESDVDFFDMANRPGDNEATADIQNFINDNQAGFAAFKWTVLEGKLAAMLNDFKAIQSFLSDISLSTPTAINRLQVPFRPHQFYQGCVKQMYTMVQSVCHQTSTPDEKQVSSIQC